MRSTPGCHSNSLTQLRATLAAAHPDLARFDAIARADAGAFADLAALGGAVDKAPFASGRRGFLPHQPDRARFARHGRMFGPGPRAQARGGGIGLVTDEQRNALSPSWSRPPAVIGVGALVDAAVVVVSLCRSSFTTACRRGRRLDARGRFRLVSALRDREPGVARLPLGDGASSIWTARFGRRCSCAADRTWSDPGALCSCSRIS